MACMAKELMKIKDGKKRNQVKLDVMKVILNTTSEEVEDCEIIF